MNPANVSGEDAPVAPTPDGDLALSPYLRAELRLASREFNGEKWYVVEDPVTDRFYRIGEAEARFAGSLDGTKTLAEALAMSERTSDSTGKSLSAEEGLTVYQWLQDVGLVVTGKADAERLEAQQSQADTTKRIQRLNPLTVRVPLFDPNTFLERVYPWLGWVTGPTFVFAWLAAIGYGGYILTTEWSAVRAASSQVIAPNNWLFLLLAWIGLKLVHELAHGLMCKRFDGHCREAGVFLILFVPLAYVDVSSIWRFASRWPRVAIAGAGMYIELFVAAIALWIWSESDPGVIRSLAYDTAVVASIGALLFNANFLMRFDGYHLLADALGIPNLYSHGQRYVSYLANRYLFGVPMAKPVVPDGRTYFVRTYGVAAALWRVVVLCGLLIGASLLFAGAGVVLALLAALVWFGPPIAKWLKRFRGPVAGMPRLHVGQVLARVGLLGALLWSCSELSFSNRVVVPGSVVYEGPEQIRVETPGFVTALFVKPGQRVEQGEPLATLQNRELRARVRALEFEIRAREIEARVLQEKRELTELAALREQIALYRKDLKTLRADVSTLVVRSSRDGIFISPGLESLEGQFLGKGHLLGEVVDESQKEIVLSLAADDSDAVSAGTMIEYQSADPAPRRAAISKVAPTASRNVEYPALSAANGGPLAVQRGERQERSTVYTHPRLHLFVGLSPEDSRRLRAGETVVAHVDSASRTIGERARRVFNAWRSEWVMPES